MAAAYLFHIVRNHPCIDGNKRMGLLAAVVFLDLNGLSIEEPTDSLYELTIAAAQGDVTKAQIAEKLRALHSLSGR
jgi:death on curing protein